MKFYAGATLLGTGTLSLLSSTTYAATLSTPVLPSGMQSIKPPVSTTAYTGDLLSSPTSIAIDTSGNPWIANPGSNSVTEVLGAAAPTTPLSTGVANDTLASGPQRREIFVDTRTGSGVDI